MGTRWLDDLLKFLERECLGWLWLIQKVIHLTAAPQLLRTLLTPAALLPLPATGMHAWRGDEKRFGVKQTFCPPYVFHSREAAFTKNLPNVLNALLLGKHRFWNHGNVGERLRPSSH
jgi:hypothetical protein